MRVPENNVSCICTYLNHGGFDIKVGNEKFCFVLKNKTNGCGPHMGRNCGEERTVGQVVCSGLK
jgi:hypothetical protein